VLCGDKVTILDEEKITENFILFIKKGEVSHITKFKTKKDIEEVKREMNEIGKTNKEAISLISELEKKGIVETIKELSTKFIIVNL
jgi:ethanolamine utilization protein EutP (predicted NTPase)